MKRKQLEWTLAELEAFPNPNVNLEQYVTPSEVAAGILCDIESDLDGKVVGDLGCGTGFLTIGAVLQGAEHCIGFEIDGSALQVLSTNATEAEVAVDVVQCDILCPHALDGFTDVFDTVLMNPPFGTKTNAGIDLKFLEVACNLANTTVYSLHKTSTREFVLKKAQSLCAGVWTPKVVAELRYDLPASYAFHRRKSVDIQVDLVQLKRKLPI